MFSRVSPSKQLISPIKTSMDNNKSSSPKSPKRLQPRTQDSEIKIKSLLKKCVDQGIRASSFKSI